jgi:flagellar biosynthesis protein FliP
VLPERTRIARTAIIGFVALISLANTMSTAFAQGRSVQASGTDRPKQPVFDDRRVGPANFEPAAPEETPPGQNSQLAFPASLDPSALTSPQGLGASMKVMLLLTVLSLAPAILMMTTCFIRMVVVMGLLRQALGTQQLPPNQVVISLCLFLTFMVMGPVWSKSYNEGIRPYTSPAAGAAPISEIDAVERTLAPLREFMSQQIDLAENGEIVWMFLDFQRPPTGTPDASEYIEPQSYADVPLLVLLPSYMLSELKVSFLIGFQIYLPFLIIDMVISSVLISMGMMMLPPVIISLPFKLLLFVMIDGWFLIVGMLLESVRPLG